MAKDDTTATSARQGTGDGGSRQPAKLDQPNTLLSHSDGKAPDGQSGQVKMGDFEVVPARVRKAPGATPKPKRAEDPVIQSLPDIEKHKPGDIIEHKPSGRRFSLRPAKKCTRCQGTGTYAAHWGEMGPAKSGGGEDNGQ